jgi:hypothetical protein
MARDASAAFQARIIKTTISMVDFQSMVEKERHREKE